MPIDEDALLCLLGAQGKETIDDIFMTCFRFSGDTVPQRVCSYHFFSSFFILKT
jgi:hypothetical protein